MEPSLIGAVLDGRYLVLDAIAEGAMGVVYRAERVKLGRIVAIKVLHDELPNELSSRKRFEIEAMAMAKLEHPHCAAVLDVGIHEERPYVVMDFVSGDNLKELISTIGPMPSARAVEIVRQVLSGLAHAHEHDIIHRDIKPANIVLSQKAGLGDHVKILDFGLARFNAEASNLTTGIVVGTPSYMAPEQIRGVALDKRCDLYACGILLFELLTGHKPFLSLKDDPIEVCSMHLKKPPPTLAEMLPGTEFGALEAIVAKALAKAPDDRYSSAEDMAAALAATPSVGVPVPAEIPPSTPVSAPALTASVVPPPSTSLEPPPSVAPVPTSATVEPSVVPVTAPPSRAPAPRSFTRRQLAIVGGGILAVVLIIALVATRGSGRKVASAPKDTGSVVDPDVTIERGDPVGDVLSRANEQISNGRRESALELLSGARKTFPRDARLAYLAGKLYFEKLWWTDGLKQFRDAVELDPSYRTDPELIKTVLKGFLTTPRYDGALAGFLRETIGDAAKPYLQETARDHTNSNLRARAAGELRRY